MNIRVFIKDSPPVEYQDVSMIGYQTEDGTWDELPLVGWTTITADPATLPAMGADLSSAKILLSIIIPGKKSIVIDAYYDYDFDFAGWHYADGTPLDWGDYGEGAIPYAWQPWPTSAPYPSADSQERPR